MSSLTIMAGLDALTRVRDEGLRSEQFRVMLGASGGPKWFVLYGLDRYLFGNFFRDRQQPLITLGTSAGAWRLSCLATPDPVGSIERLAHLYCYERYSSNPGAAEITDKARRMLDAVLGPEGGTAIVNNPLIKTHIIADRCRGIGSNPLKPLQALLLATAALANTADRRLLSLFFERTLFTTMGGNSPWAQLQDLDTQLVHFTEHNVRDALLASGSIPFALEGVRDIAGAKPGLYWDGGITDYHFDLPLCDSEQLVLYPHFFPQLKPGWFDKHLPWRKSQEANYRNVVMLVPSEEFVSKLPYGKIPDRKDFNTMEYQSRVEYWRQVLDRSQHLADEFAELVEKGNGANRIRPLNLNHIAG